ncbi:hypothetical protein GC176_03460 [bacterium]|nr:hypothetical protein [bacterium]
MDSGHWQDGFGRAIVTATDVTNGGSGDTPLSARDAIPARSDTVLVTTTAYEVCGMPKTATS